MTISPSSNYAKGNFSIFVVIQITAITAIFLSIFSPNKDLMSHDTVSYCFFSLIGLVILAVTSVIYYRKKQTDLNTQSLTQTHPVNSDSKHRPGSFKAIQNADDRTSRPDSSLSQDSFCNVVDPNGSFKI